MPHVCVPQNYLVDSGLGEIEMQSITEHITDQQLLSDLVRVGRMDAQTAEMHTKSGELLASHGVSLELQTNMRRKMAREPAKSFRIELSGRVFYD